MDRVVSFRKCTLTNQQLLNKVDEMTNGLYDVKHKSERDRILTRHIPAKPNSDYDLLIGELVLRFKEMNKAVQGVLKRYNESPGEMHLPDYIKNLEKLINQESEDSK